MTGDTLGDDVTTTDPLGNTITDALNNDNAADNVRVFDVTGGASTLDGLVITGGLANYGKKWRRRRRLGGKRRGSHGAQLQRVGQRQL